jgi:hypothetical protein
LWIVVRDEDDSARVVVRDSTTLDPLGGFNFPNEFPRPPFALSPGPGKTTWVLGQDLSGIIPSASRDFTQALYRLNPDGSLDESFPPQILPDDLRYVMYENEGPGLTLKSFSRRQANIGEARLIGGRFEFRDAEAEIASTSFLSTFPFHSYSRNQHATSADAAFGFEIGELAIIRSSENGIETLVTLDPADFPVGLTSLEVEPEGSFLIGGTRRYLESGMPDPAWRIPRLEGPTRIRDLIPLVNDRVLAVGYFDRASGLRRLGAVSLKPDGSLDPDFAPEIDLRYSKEIHQKQNGNLLVLMTHDAPKRGPFSLEILELDTTGTLVGVMPLNFAGNGYSPETGGYFTGTIEASFDLQPDDSIILSVKTGLDAYPFGSWRIPAHDPGNPFELGISTVRVLPDGRLLVGSEIRTPEGAPDRTAPALPARTSFHTALDDHRLLLTTFEDGKRRWFQWDSTSGRPLPFEVTDLNVLRLQRPGFKETARDKMLIGEQAPDPFPGLNPSFAHRWPPAGNLRRFHPDGSLDPTFEVAPNSGTSILAFLPRDPDSSSPTIWVAGNFSEINGVPRQALAIVADHQASGFQEWMRACAGINPDLPTRFDEDGDEDGDGLSNFFEYAAGSHPLQRLPIPQGLLQTGPLTWQVACNPEAPDILRRLEVSENLIDWRPAQAGDLRLKSGQRCLSWTMQNQEGSKYARLKVSR